MNKGRAGFLVLGHPDYQNDIGLDMAVKGVEGLKKLNNDIVFVKESILDPITSGKKAIDLLGMDLDCLILFMGTWVESPVTISVIKELSHIPLLIWGFPMFKNDKGMLDSTGSFVAWSVIQGPLKRTNTKCKYVLGAVDDDKTLGDITSFINVARAKKALRRTRLGLVGYAAMGMYPGTFDHVLLSNIVGPEVVQIDGYKLVSLAESFSEGECKKVIERVKSYARIADDVSEKHLIKAARIYLATQKLVKDYSLDVINVKCQYELSQDYGCIACVPLSLLAEDNIVCACEGDALITATMTMLNYLSGQIVYYGDVLTTDDENMYLSSCGFVPFSLASDPKKIVIRDINHKGFNGPITSLVLRQGRVTYARINEGRCSYKVTMGTGTGVETQLRQGRFPALNIKIDGEMDKFLKSFESQHYAICYGDYVEQISQLCELLDMDVEII
ncbi:MAG: hypothetical protein M1371_03460 [Actinobacteria bacterium]|nr:hypothetical protein [Actinomycetota bacterium]